MRNVDRGSMPGKEIVPPVMTTHLIPTDTSQALPCCGKSTWLAHHGLLEDRDKATTNDDIPSCAFCGFSSESRDWVTFREAESWGDGPRTEDMWLCELCRNSYSVSRWLSSGEYDVLAKDTLMCANRVLAKMDRCHCTNSVQR